MIQKKSNFRFCVNLFLKPGVENKRRYQEFQIIKLINFVISAFRRNLLPLLQNSCNERFSLQKR